MRIKCLARFAIDRIEFDKMVIFLYIARNSSAIKDANDKENVRMQTISIEETYTLWHRILGFMLEKLLTPLGLQVLTDHAIMSGPLQADVVIVRRDTDFWTDEQRVRMCDVSVHSPLVG